MHRLLTELETQAEELRAGSVPQLLHTSITIFRGDAVSCFPSFLNLNMGLGTYVMQWVNNGLFFIVFQGTVSSQRSSENYLLGTQKPPPTLIACFLF